MGSLYPRLSVIDMKYTIESDLISRKQEQGIEEQILRLLGVTHAGGQEGRSKRDL